MGFGRPGTAGRAAGLAGLKVHADFEGGNVAGVEFVAPDHVRVQARTDGSPRPLWFHFCIEEATTPAVRVDLINADECLGPRLGWRFARPVFSSDGVHWQRVVRTNYVKETEQHGYFDFTVPIVSRHTYVAYCYPCYTTDLLPCLNACAARPDGDVRRLCLSAEGRPVPLVRLGNLAEPRCGVWVIARQHAGESPASFVAEGLLAWAAGDDPQAAALRAEAALHVVPLVDVDGVFHGRCGKDREPVDFNRDWCETPTHPQIEALIAQTAAWAAGHPYDLLIDLHAPHHGETACFVFADEASEPEATVVARRRLMQLLAEESPAEVGFRADDIRQGAAPPGSARDHQARTHGVLVLCLEISYHFSRSGSLLTPALYRGLGASLGRALERRLRTP
jgi:Cytosolic carboxypeptidase N-terminal domain/Zinc carboxypeptidase